MSATTGKTPDATTAPDRTAAPDSAAGSDKGGNDKGGNTVRRHSAGARRERRRTSRSRREVVRRHFSTLTDWTLRLLVVAGGGWLLLYLAGLVWPVLLPLLLALMLSAVLWPAVKWFRRHLPAPVAALLGIAIVLALLAAGAALLMPLMATEVTGLAAQASAGLDALRDWLTGPPLNLRSQTLNAIVDQAGQQLSSHGQAVAGFVLNSLGAIGSTVLTLILSLVLTFFLLKDGPSFLPWLRGWVGSGFGRHTAEVTSRVWTALGHYVWSQAAVAAVDAILIGVFVAIIGLPYALPIAVLTFFGGFVPIVGATVAGGIATLVGLVSGGIWVAVAVLGWIIVVQNVEGNLLQPLLVGRTLRLHPAIILLAVTLGGTLWGIVGALLAAPTVATVQVVARYVREQLTAASSSPVDDRTPDGRNGQQRERRAEHDAGRPVGDRAGQR